MAKKKNYKPKAKAQNQIRQPKKPNKRIKKKYEKKEALRLAAKQGVTEKAVKRGYVSRQDFNLIVTREKRKEQAISARRAAYDKKRKYAAGKGIPDK